MSWLGNFISRLRSSGEGVGKKTTTEKREENPHALSTMSYYQCRKIYREWFIGKRVVEALPRYALSSGRKIIMQDAPQEVIEQFEKTFHKYKALKTIKNFAFATRIYGLAGIYVATDNKADKRENLLKKEVLDSEIYFNVVDPLIISGAYISQDPTSKDFGRVASATINGRKVGGSRFFGAYNGMPLYLDRTPSTFNFAGVSVYNNMQDLIQLWGDLFYALRKISVKASSILITGNLSGYTDGATLDVKKQNAEFMQELYDGVAQMPAGSNAQFFNLNGIQELNSIIAELRSMLAMALDDTPATILLDKSFASGFGEGQEDMNSVIMAVNNYREDYLRPAFDFIDSYIFYKAWDDKFLNELRLQYSDKYGNVGNAQLREYFIDQFRYEFESIRPPTVDEETKRKLAVLDMLLKAKDLGADLASIEKELNESEVFNNEIDMVEPQSELMETEEIEEEDGGNLETKQDI